MMPIQREKILSLLGERPGRIICRDEISSTNTALKELAAEGEAHGAVMLAERQTGGRGRQGRSFESPPGSGIYMSMLLRPNCTPEKALSITPGVAVAVCGAVGSITKAECKIKWTNDIILGGKKIGGILTEMSVSPKSGRAEYIVIGVGLNVNSSSGLSDDVRRIAGSIFDATGKTADRNALAAAIIASLDDMYSRWQKDGRWCLEQYRSLCLNIGRPAMIKQSGELVTVLGVEEDFSLLARRSDGSEMKISEGEVSLRSPDGSYI